MESAAARMLMTASILKREFDKGLPFDDFVRAAEPGHQPQWRERFSRLELAPDQLALVEAFTREVESEFAELRGGPATLTPAELARVRSYFVPPPYVDGLDDS